MSIYLRKSVKEYPEVWEAIRKVVPEYTLKEFEFAEGDYEGLIGRWPDGGHHSVYYLVEGNKITRFPDETEKNHSKKCIFVDIPKGCFTLWVHRHEVTGLSKIVVTYNLLKKEVRR